MSRLLLLIPLCAALWTAASGAAPPRGCSVTGWPQFRHDACGGGATSGNAAPARTAVPRLTEAWSYRTAGRAGTPVVADGTVYVLSAGGRLHAVALATGRRRWSVPAGVLNPSTVPAPAVAGDRVVSLDAANVLRAFDRRTGSVRWRLDIGTTQGGLVGSPVIVGSTVIVRSHEQVAAASLGTGAILWQSEAIGCFGCSVVADANRVYAAGQRGRDRSEMEPDGLFALDLRTGAELWHGPAGISLTARDFTAPSRGDARLYARVTTRAEGVRQIALVAWAASSGAELWRTTLGTSRFVSFSHPATGAGVVAYPSADGRLHALDPRTGNSRWTVRIGATDGSPSIANGVVYVVGARHRLLALDTRNGQVLWRSRAPAATGPRSTPNGSPTLAGGYVLLGTVDGRLVAYRPSRR